VRSTPHLPISLLPFPLEPRARDLLASGLAWLPALRASSARLPDCTDMAATASEASVSRRRRAKRGDGEACACPCSFNN
jgi:hypothetical protein